MSVPVSERVVFSSVFEALARVVAAQRPALVAKLVPLGVDLTKLQPAYPANVWRDATHLVATELFPSFSAPVAEYRLGQEIIREYGKTLIGRALMATLSVLGPRRAFGRVSRSFRTANNYTEDTVVTHGQSDFELWLNEVHVPWVDQGVMQAALETIGAKNCRVDVVSRDEQGTTYRCRWD
jgi:uncharacterized protein (TIGR02265 family)